MPIPILSFPICGGSNDKKAALYYPMAGLDVAGGFVLTPLPGLRSEKQDYREQLLRGDFISRGEMLQFLETWSDFTAKNIFSRPISRLR